MMKVPFFVPWINNDDKKAVLKTLDQRWLTNGPNLKKFEENFHNFIGTKYSIGVGSATQALHLALRTINISKGDEVIVPTFTFAATANAVLYCGAKPVFCDVDLDSYNILADEIKKKISRKTKAVIVVHYGGQACDMEQIKKITKNNDLHLIEDCAHACGSTYKNKKCGNIGTMGCFSFYPTKVITTGEGGMISTNNKKFSEKLRMLRSQGLSIQSKDREKKGKWNYDVVDLGYNYRLDEIRSSLGISQLNRIKKINNLRKRIAEKYDKLLKEIEGISIPKRKSNRDHIFHLYTIKIEPNYHETRNNLFKKLFDKGIGTAVQYVPLHLMSYYKNYLSKSDLFPNADLLGKQVLSLPIFPTMTDKQIQYVVNQLK